LFGRTHPQYISLVSQRKLIQGHMKVCRDILKFVQAMAVSSWWENNLSRVTWNLLLKQLKKIYGCPSAWYLLKWSSASGHMVGYYWVVLRNQNISPVQPLLFAGITCAFTWPSAYPDKYLEAIRTTKSGVIRFRQWLAAWMIFCRAFSALRSFKNWVSKHPITLVFIISSILFIVFLHVLWNGPWALKTYHPSAVRRYLW